MFNWILSFVVISMILFTSSCTEKDADSKPESSSDKKEEFQIMQSDIYGVVLETMNASSYTYVHVETQEGKKVWAAAPHLSINKGDSVRVPKGTPMKDYYSKTLNRKFDVVYFVEGIENRTTPSGPNSNTGTNPHIRKESADQKVDFSGIVKPQNGYTISEIFKNKEQLTGKSITLRAKIIKTNFNILGTNWYHLRDGTGEEGSNDLTITAQFTAKTGDIVKVKGILTQNKDFGHGYFYPLIIEKAENIRE